MGACWVTISRRRGAASGIINVRDFGAKGDGTTDDAAAITAAIAQLGINGRRTLYFPASSGAYLDSATRDFQNSNQYAIVGDGQRIDVHSYTAAGGTETGTPHSEWRFTGTGATPFIDASKAAGFTIDGIAIRHSSASFSANLVQAQYCYGTTIRDSLISGVPTGGTGGVQSSAAALALDYGVEALIENTTLGFGQTNFSGYQLNVATFNNVRFGGSSSKAITNWGRQWSFQGCHWQSADGGSLGFDTQALGVSFDGCGWWDATVLGPSNWITGGAGAGLTFTGCYFEIKNGGSAFGMTAAAGLSVVGCDFEMSGAGSANVFSNTAAIVGLVYEANRHAANITDNSKTISGPVLAGSTMAANRQTGSYTLVIGDAGRVVEMNVAGANNLTVPPNSSVAFPTGTVIEAFQYGAGQTTIVAGAGVTLRSPGGKLKIAAQYGAASLRKLGTDEWAVEGNITT